MMVAPTMKLVTECFYANPFQQSIFRRIAEGNSQSEFNEVIGIALTLRFHTLR